VPGGATGPGGTAGTGAGFGVGTLLPGGGGGVGLSNLPYYVDPALTSQVVQSLIGVLQTATSPDAVEAQNILLRRLALEGDVIGSRVPPPRNITEIGGYLNLLTKLHETTMRQQTLAGILGVAGPSQPLGWISNRQPLALVPLNNDRPAGAAQATYTLSFLVRSDFQSALEDARKLLRASGVALPFSSPPRIALPPLMPGASAPSDILFYLGRTLMIAPSAALLDPSSDPVVLARASGGGGSFELYARVLAPGSVTVTQSNYDALACTTTNSQIVPLADASLVALAPVLANAGFYPANPSPTPSTNLDTAWTRLTNITGLVAGSTRLGDELSLLYRQDEIVNSVLAPLLNLIWDGKAFSAS
jgi:hypothetical protein